MNKLQDAPSPTSNDLLFGLRGASAGKTQHYAVIAQSADEVSDTQNAPAVSMGGYLIDSEQVGLLTTISIYSERGGSRDQVRLLYMNETALRIWKAMGRSQKLIGTCHRPPKTALLTFGIPFSE